MPVYLACYGDYKREDQGVSIGPWTYRGVLLLLEGRQGNLPLLCISVGGKIVIWTANSYNVVRRVKQWQITLRRRGQWHMSCSKNSFTWDKEAAEDYSEVLTTKDLEYVYIMR